MSAALFPGRCYCQNVAVFVFHFRSIKEVLWILNKHFGGLRVDWHNAKRSKSLALKKSLLKQAISGINFYFLIFLE